MKAHEAIKAESLALTHRCRWVLSPTQMSGREFRGREMTDAWNILQI